MFRIVNIYALLWFVFVLVAMTDVVADFIPTMGWLIGGLVLLVLGIRQLVLRDQTTHPRPARAVMARWFPLLMWALGSTLVLGGFGVYLRFLVSKPALTRFAQSIRTGTTLSFRGVYSISMTPNSCRVAVCA